MNLFSILEDAAKKWPEDTAVVHGGRSFTYSDLCVAAESLAIKVRQAGVQPGDKVGVMFPSSPECLIAYFAVLRVDGIVVPIPPALTSGEISDLAREMALDAFCYNAHFRSLMPQGDEGTVKEFSFSRGRTSLYVKLASTRATPQSERDRLRKLNAAFIGFSSGTTSKAKGIIYSRATVLARGIMRRPIPPITKSSSVLWMRAMDRTLSHQITACLLEGAKIILANTLVVEPLSQLIQEQDVDQIYAGPLFFRMLLQQGLTKEDLRRVRYFVSGGISLPNSVAEGFRVRFGREICQTYGLAECSPGLVNASGDPGKRGSVGKPVAGREVKLAPLDSDVSGDDVGELLVRGPGLFDGYYKPWRLLEEVLEDGWFRTGDLARRDADGYYWIVGRTKEMINVGGVKVFPYEIEEVLLSHPAVEEAVVYGVAEGRFGEVPHAKVKLRAGATCAEREILRYVNERVSVFKSLRGLTFVDEILKTVTGKPRRLG